MRLLKLLLLVPMLVALGCPATPKSTSTPAAKAPVAKDGAVAPDTGASEESEVALQAPAAGAVKINPQNTKIEFVGTKPEGKHEGGFKKFLGGIEVKDDKVAKIAVEIDTSSLYADNPKLTGHLKSPDFFDVKTHPKSAFASTEVKAEDGKGTTHVVTGDFTLHGVKKSIAFPAKIDVAATAVTVASEFKINRSDFGMTFGQGKVDDPVTIKVSVKAPRQQVDAMPSWQMLVELALYGGLIPAVAAAVVLSIALRSRWPIRSEAARWGAGLALAAGYIVGHALVEESPWRPTHSWDWLSWLALLAASLEMLEAACALPAVIAWGLRLGAVTLAAWLLVPGLPHLEQDRWAWRAGMALSILAVWLPLTALARRQPGPTLPVLLGLIALAAAVVLELDGFGSLGQRSGALAAAALGIGVVAWTRPDQFFGQGLVFGIAILLMGMLGNGYFYHDPESGVPFACFLLIAVAPILLALTGMAVRWLPSGRGQAICQVLAALVPVGLAIALAALTWSGEHE